VGSYIDGSGNEDGFLYSNGTWTTLDDPLGVNGTFADGINASGQIVGSYIDRSGNANGFLYSNGTWTTLDDPSAINGTFANGINASGQMVGSYTDSSGHEDGFLYSNGTWTTLDDPLGIDTTAYAINNAGQIVGSYVDSSGNANGFLYSNGTWTTLDYPSAITTTAYGINASGDIVGSYTDSSGNMYGFLYNNGTWTTVNDPSGASDSTPYGVNDGGQIVESNNSGTSFVGTLSTTISVPFDFNGDGVSDVLWRNSNGSLAEWFMDGSAISSTATPTYQGSAVSPGASWSVAGIGDFTGDGDADILWRNSNGSLVEWLMNGSTIESTATPTYQGSAVSPGASWSVAGIGDFNGDGADDILWQNTNGSLAMWLMNGSTIESSVTPTCQGSAVSPSASWSVAGIGDFTGDGDADILWRNSNGSLAMWLMDGSTIESSTTPTYQGSAVSPGSSWSVAGIGDFNGDGDADILWRNSNGSLAMWLMDGSTIESSATPTYQGSAVSPDSSWNIVEIGDFTGNGDSDILWQQSTTGALVEWQMNGSQIVSSQSVTSQGAPVAPSSWTSQAKPTDFA
jgi:probable HAF family extracellular repeat protein